MSGKARCDEVIVIDNEVIETQSVGQNLEVEVLFPVIETSTAVRQEQNVHPQKGAKPTEKKSNRQVSIAID